MVKERRDTYNSNNCILRKSQTLTAKFNKLMVELIYFTWEAIEPTEVKRLVQGLTGKSVAELGLEPQSLDPSPSVSLLLHCGFIAPKLSFLTTCPLGNINLLCILYAYHTED